MIYKKVITCMIFFNLTMKMIWSQVFYELGNKLQPLNNGIRTGDWVHLSELLGFSRQQINHFEVQSTIQREPPGFLMLMEWRSHEDRSTLFILRDTLWTCGRHDCVSFLDRRVEGKNTNSWSVIKHYKNVDTTHNYNALMPLSFQLNQYFII